MARDAQLLKESIYREYDRLVAEEYSQDVIRAQFLPRWYYVKKIVALLDIRSESYVYQILKLRFGKNGK
jgi:hypothetical protein